MLGLAITAIIALGALVVEPAAAVPLTVEGGASGTTFYTGDQDNSSHEFVTPAGTVKCTTAVFTGSSTGASVNELTLAPSYSGCTAFGFAGTDVKVNGCTYTFTTPKKSTLTTVTWSNVNENGIQREELHIICPAGKKIEITPTSFGASVCTQFIGPQTPGWGHVTGRNAGTSLAMDITLEFTLESIVYTGSGGACGTSGVAAKYTGKSTISAYSSETHFTQRGLTISL